jgi:oligopeptide transport system permease protein
MKRPTVILSLAVLVLLVLAALVGPVLVPHAYDAIDKQAVRLPPLSGSHLLGTDALGRDLLALLLIGLRMSLAIGAAATAVSLGVGLAWGVTAGYLGGRADDLMMRLVDVLYALPFIFFVILLTMTFGRSLVLLFLAIGVVEWLTVARIVRGLTLSLKQREFIEAARAAGVSPVRIMVRHIAPNVMGQVVAYAALTVPSVIMAESFLSFLGLGVQPPLTSLGALISWGAQEMDLAPWTLAAPTLVMAVLLLCLNLLGEGLRRRVDGAAR